MILLPLVCICWSDVYRKEQETDRHVLFWNVKPSCIFSTDRNNTWKTLIAQGTNWPMMWVDAGEEQYCNATKKPRRSSRTLRPVPGRRNCTIRLPYCAITALLLLQTWFDAQLNQPPPFCSPVASDTLPCRLLNMLFKAKRFSLSFWPPILGTIGFQSAEWTVSTQWGQLSH